MAPPSSTRHDGRVTTGIGTLHEGALHKALKQWLARPGDLFEHAVDGYVVDVVRDGLLIEIQTGGFAPLQKKLTKLLEAHRVRLVAPLARTKVIERVDENGVRLSRRRSPRQGRIEEIFEKLVSVPALIGHRNFEIEVIEIVEAERRAHQAGRARRRKGWVVVGRDLVDVVERNLIRGAADLAALLPASLAPQFSTADLARHAALPRPTAQQMLYCLHIAHAVERVGKTGNAHLYRRLL